MELVQEARELALGCRRAVPKSNAADGTETSIVFAWLKRAQVFPNPLLPGTALYGGHFLYGKNSRPALGGDTIEKWFHRSRTEEDPDRDDKWEGHLDSTAVGFGLVLGTQVDRGRPWNLQLGTVWADSQWLLHGYLNIVKQRPNPANTTAGSLRLLGAWGDGRLFGSVRWTENVPADGKVMKIDLGAEMLVDNASDESHFYAGFHWPPDRHLKAILLERYESQLLPDAGRCRRRELRQYRPDTSRLCRRARRAVLD